MMDELRRRIRRLLEKKAGSPPSEPGAAVAAEPCEPGAGAGSGSPRVGPADDYAVPVSSKERRHDGWSEIRPRRPGEDTDMGRDLIPDITDPGDLAEKDGS